MEIIFLISFLAVARVCLSAPTNLGQRQYPKNFIPGRLGIEGATLGNGVHNHIQVIPRTGVRGDPPIISTPGRPQPQPAAPQGGAGCAGTPPDPCNPYGPPPPYGAAPDPYGQYPVQQPGQYGVQQPSYPMPYPAFPPVQPGYPPPPPPASQPCGVPYPPC